MAGKVTEKQAKRTPKKGDVYAASARIASTGGCTAHPDSKIPSKMSAMPGIPGDRQTLAVNFEKRKPAPGSSF